MLVVVVVVDLVQEQMVLVELVAVVMLVLLELQTWEVVAVALHHLVLVVLAVQV